MFERKLLCNVNNFPRFFFLFKHFLASNDVPPAVSKRVSLSVHCKYISPSVYYLTIFVHEYIQKKGMQIIIYAILWLL